MIEKLQSYIKHNQKNLEYVRNTYPRNDKWIGTVDYAVARLNTLILRLINTPLKLDEHRNDLEKCQKIIDDFVKHVRRYYNWPLLLKWYPKVCVYWTGIRHIPKIKKLLNYLYI